MNKDRATWDRERQLRASIAARLHAPPFYRIEDSGSAITCLRCHKTSWNTNDVAQRYCGRCNLFLDNLLIIYTITHKTLDYGDNYAVRRFLISEGRAVPDTFLGAPRTLGAARALLPPALTRIDREPDDDPVIVESWL